MFVQLDGWSGRAVSAIVLAIAIALFAISSLTPTNLKAFRTSSADVLAPLIALVNLPFQSIATSLTSVTGVAGLELENQRLKAENARLRDWYQAAMQLKATNESLENLLHVAVEPQNRYVTARVIADAGNSYVKTLLVFAGRANGVQAEQAVISGDGLIGRTVEVGERASRILLITDINSRVPVMVEGQNIRAIMAGRNDDIPVLTRLPPEGRPQPGARILTSGHGGVFPLGLPVGVVVGMSDGSFGVRMYADTEKLIHVRIIDHNNDPQAVAGELDRTNETSAPPKIRH